MTTLVNFWYHMKAGPQDLDHLAMEGNLDLDHEKTKGTQNRMNMDEYG